MVSVLPRSVRVAVIVVVSCRFIGLVLLELAEVRVEPLEALLPVRSVVADPVGDVPQRSGLEPPGTPLRLAARSMSPARSSTRRCFEIAGWLRSNGAPRSFTDASPFGQAARMARRVGSARAAKVTLSGSGCLVHRS